VGAFQSNCYLVRPSSGGPVVVVDPGADEARIASMVEVWEERPAAILLTHAHVDHVGAVAGLVERYGTPIYLHPADRGLYDAAGAQAAAFGLHVDPPPPPDHDLADGQRLEFGTLRFEVRHAPGHSPGGVVFVSGKEAFVGDCVFMGSIGRTDLPGGDTATLMRSIRETILSLPPSTRLWPGHGPATTVGREAASNPFLAAARPGGAT
jgi:glyoxylase-like metal-dependent hydrolase (beta-lactamase superfamily II)